MGYDDDDDDDDDEEKAVMMGGSFSMVGGCHIFATRSALVFMGVIIWLVTVVKWERG
jgi:hypothetical protein